MILSIVSPLTEIKSLDLNSPPFSLTINLDVKLVGSSDSNNLLYASGDRLIPFFANFNKILLVILVKIFIFYINKL